MFKLAKMQETLLKRSVDNRERNLENYCQTVIQLDSQAFSSLVDELNLISEHNRTLEEELQFLEQIKNSYEQLYELQLTFKRVCEDYGKELKLSDLSQINIPFINKRLSIISGYLVNQKNIVINKERLDKLNDQLVNEEKNNKFIIERLLNYEKILRENFVSAEGRAIVGGKLQYISVVSEYKEVGYDFKELLQNVELLKSLLSSVSEERDSVEEKLKTANICYNTNPSYDTRLVCDEIGKEFYKVKYKLILLKILQLLVNDYSNFDLFKEKREKILDLLKHRNICLNNLDIQISIDPFSRTKVTEQLEDVAAYSDNSKLIVKIKKEIAELSDRIENMYTENERYSIELNDVEDLIISKIGISDIDISNVVLDFITPIENERKDYLSNQVVEVKECSDLVNMNIVKQKTDSVIKRVNEMISSRHLQTESNAEVLAPELVIVSKPVVKFDKIMETDTLLESVQHQKNDLNNNLENNKVQLDAGINFSIFETVEPFEATPLFTEKVEDADEIHVNKIDSSKLNLSANDGNMGMPDLVWDVQMESVDSKIDGEVEHDFEQQIEELLADNDIDSKIKKLVA